MNWSNFLYVALLDSSKVYFKPYFSLSHTFWWSVLWCVFLLAVKQNSQNAYEKVMYKTMKYWHKCKASIASLKNTSIFSFHHEHWIKDLFAHSSCLQTWLILYRQDYANVSKTWGLRSVVNKQHTPIFGYHFLKKKKIRLFK